MQKRLEENLKILFPTDGSTECTLTWKHKDTPAGRQYCQLAPSMRHIKEIGYGLWRTATTEDAARGVYKDMDALKNRLARGKEMSLGNQAALATWAAPNTMDGMDARSQEAMRRMLLRARKDRSGSSNLREQVIPELYPAALWPTATVRDYKGVSGKGRQERKGHPTDTLSNATSGLNTTGLYAEMEKPGASPQLNPAFVSWLMGYSTAHHSSMLSAMQSYRKSPRGSSKRQCKAKHKGDK